MESIYKLGFEELYVNGGIVAASEAVISSVVPLDSELLIIGNVASIDEWRAVCHKLSIVASVIDNDGSTSDLICAVEAILASNNHISHIICGSERCEACLAAIGMLARKYKRSFIVVDTTDCVEAVNMKLLNVDFLISNTGNITARRNKLVQTEGNARTSGQDIYAMWQRSMSHRCATLEPMAC